MSNSKGGSAYTSPDPKSGVAGAPKPRTNLIVLDYSREQQAAMGTRIQLGEFPELVVVYRHFAETTVFHTSPNSSFEMLCGVHAGGDDASWMFDADYHRPSTDVWCEGCLRGALILRLEPVWPTSQ